MKIIDTHTHLPGWTFESKPRPISDLRREFETEGLVGAWLFTTDGLIRDTAKNNDILVEAVEGHRDFFVPFGTVNPHDGTESALRELERTKFQLGFKGIKFHPWLQAFSMTHPAILPILSRAGELSMPVVFHDGTPPYSSPLQIAAVAEKVPHTTIILGHAGLDDLYRDAILACKRQPNIHLCLCGPSSGYLREILHNCPVDRLLFGSDGGFGADLIAWRIATVRETGADPETLQKIFYENPLTLISKAGVTQ
ncbi:MAG: amidohydrolase family protein [Phycisphaerae bacterium]